MIPYVRADGHPVTELPGNDYMAKLHYRLRDRLPMWVVYRPITCDYPGQWVARMRITLPEDKPTRFVITHDTLAELRAVLPPGLIRLPRYPNDVAVIEEVWL